MTMMVTKLPLYDCHIHPFYYWYIVTTTIFHHFRDITTFTVCVTASDLEMSFSFEKTVE